ncbi:MAG: hypothetical protein OXD43_07065 [Bacteroidetes bacterium]|nr:hypothetical protein [Bacteroidota bacterium]
MPIGVGVIRPATGGLTEVLKFYAGMRLPIHNVEFSREGATKEGYTRGKKPDVFGLPFQPNNYDVILRNGHHLTIPHNFLQESIHY